MEPRIGPGGPGEIGVVNQTIARIAGAASGGPPPRVFTTLARHRRLFRRWLRFAGALMPGGRLPRSETELLILRVAHNTDCEYEWRQHARIALSSGLTAAEVERVRESADHPEWSPRRRALLRAADELHAERTISDETWDELRPLLTDEQLIELCMLVGHYEMLAMTLLTLRVEPDELPEGRPPRAMRVLGALAARRQRPEAGPRR